ncbi:hypothetical protein [Streptomyces angustmyceticus]|uniref:hypothetical protein n=1 Tax=Streptomyces angustmyceticus TaxID=285578 RepID=UPI00344EF590
MVPATPATSRRSIAGYQAARISLDVFSAFLMMAAAGSFAVVAFDNTHEGFVTAGVQGRAFFSGLVAVMASYGAGSICDLLFGGLRDRLVEAHRGLLIDAAKDARERHAKAQAAVDMGASHIPPYLAVLAADADKAEDRALRAGVLPAELG